MKFAEQLADEMVPEWKEKYLDYKAGKKMIKKIALSPLVKSITNTVQSGQPGLRLGDFSFRQNQDHNKAPPLNSSFKLPPAAITPELAAANFPPHEVPKSDRTPLLQAHKDHTSSNIRNRTISSPHDPKVNGNPSSSTKVSTPQPPSTYGGGSAVLNEGYPLNNMFDTTHNEFIEWLDSERAKIENFYREKEEHCVTRYLLLQDQMFHLREEKLRMKSKTHTESEELLKLGIAKTTKKLNKLNKYELPSLPKNPFQRPDRQQPTDARDNRRDYEHHRHAVPYYVARRQLKAAVQEFYRELELLKSYRMLNRTGFRKLVKKFDKQTNSTLSLVYMEKVNSAYFASSDVLDNLIPKVEDLYSSNFENGNRKIAVEKLRSKLSEDHFYSSVFVSGLLLGISIPLFAYAVYFGLHKTFTGELPGGKYLLQIWAGFFLILLMACLFSINCFVWAKYKVNYRFIFEFNPKTALNYREFLFLPSLLLFLLCIFGWFSFNDFWPHDLPARFWPWFFFGFGMLVMFTPLDVFFLESRKWLIITLWRLLLSGLYPVEFRDFFMGDIFCSLSYTMGNISFFFCMYATHWSGAAEGNPICGSSRSHLMGFFSALPPIWRFLQCIRRFADSGDWFPHLANMMKYAVTIVYYMTLSFYRIDSSSSHKAVFIFFAIVNSIYSSLWDVFMDWSLMQNKWLLRNDVVYPKWFYYFSIVSDVILRFQWIFYALFNRQIEQSAVTSFCVAVAEIVRRFIWIFIRMENEHISNIHMFRASREAPLPYETIIRSSRTESEHEVEEEHTDQTAPDDIETGYASVEGQAPSSSLKRRGTILTSDVLRTVTKAIVNAHAKDFQRRKSKPGDDAEENSSDEDNSDSEQ